MLRIPRWPHAKRCPDEAVVTVHVDGDDLEVCAAHATEAQEFNDSQKVNPW